MLTSRINMTLNNKNWQWQIFQDDICIAVGPAFGTARLAKRAMERFHDLITDEEVYKHIQYKGVVK